MTDTTDGDFIEHTHTEFIPDCVRCLAAHVEVHRTPVDGCERCTIIYTMLSTSPERTTITFVLTVHDEYVPALLPGLRRIAEAAHRARDSEVHLFTNRPQPVDRPVDNPASQD